MTKIIKHQWAEVIQNVLGWISFVAWSASFYPQSFDNYNAKSVAGFSLEFAMLNPVGFYFYTVYNIQGSVDESIGLTGTIYANDLVFAVHAFMLSSVQLTQIFMYDRGKQDKVNRWIVALLIFEFVTVTTIFIIEVVDPSLINQNWATIRMCGYCKALITLVKYMPQVFLNWQRKSTVGWSLANVLLDFTGGFFSFCQQGLDNWNQNKKFVDFGGSDGFNIVKFLLSVIAMIFDIIFMFQHYVLYRDKWVHLKKLKKAADREKKMNDYNKLTTD